MKRQETQQRLICDQEEEATVRCKQWLLLTTLGWMLLRRQFYQGGRHSHGRPGVSDPGGIKRWECRVQQFKTSPECRVPGRRLRTTFSCPVAIYKYFRYKFELCIEIFQNAWKEEEEECKILFKSICESGTLLFVLSGLREKHGSSHKRWPAVKSV